MQTQKKTAARTIEPKDFLVPDPALRRRPAATPFRTSQIEDAVFEVVAAKPHGYRRMNDNPPRVAPGDIEILPFLARAAGIIAAAAERKLAGLSPQAFVTLLTSAVLSVFWLCGGFSALGASAANGPVAPFTLVDTAIRAQDANGMQVAMVTGGVRNTSGRIIEAPRLAVVSGRDGDIIGTVVLPVDRIGPGVTIPFTGRFRLAGGKSSDIVIIPERP